MWVTKTEWIEGYRVTWKRTRCGMARRARCKCRYPQPDFWHGPYAYLHVTVGHRSRQVACGRAIDATMVCAIIRAARRGHDVHGVIAKHRERLA